VSPHLRPPGPEAVFATVRRRRRNRTVATGALALALIAGPLIGYGLTNGPNPKVPTPATSTSTDVSVSPSVAPSPSASAPSPSADASSVVITSAELRNATLPMPDLEPEGNLCPNVSVTLTDGRGGGKGEAQVDVVGEVLQVDVDSDGDKDAIVLLRCDPKQSDFVVAAYTRDKAGKIVLLGLVARTGGAREGDGVPMHIYGIRADGRRIAVDLGDYRVCCDRPSSLSSRITMRVQWDGDRFAEVGSASFPANPRVINLGVAVKPNALTQRSDGTWAGRVVFTVSNDGTKAMANPAVSLTFSEDLAGASFTWKGGGCPAVSKIVPGTVYGPCTIAARLNGVGQVSPSIELVSPSSPSGSITATVTSVLAGGGEPYDLDPENNTATAVIEAG
jgi:hypothetical protein